MNYRLGFIFAAIYLSIELNASAQVSAPTGERFEASPDNSSSGAYSVATFVREGDYLTLATILVDWKDQNAFLLTVDNELIPTSTMFNGALINFKAKDQELIPVDFSFSLHNPLVGTQYVERKEHVDAKSTYKIPIPDLLANCTCNEVTLRSDVADEIVHCETGNLALCYRMPAESAFFGYPLRSFLAFRKDGTHQWYFNIVRVQSENGRISHPGSSPEFKTAVMADSSKSYCQSLFIGAHRPAWAKLLSDKLYSFGKMMANELVAGLTQDEAYQFERTLLDILEEITRHSDTLLNDGESLFFDPFVRGMMMEQALWQPQINPAPVSKIISVLLNDLRKFKGDQSLTFSLFCAYADLGVAPTHTSYVYLLGTGQTAGLSALDTAVLAARWKMQTHPNQVGAVLDHLASTKLMADRMKCVETLILMGQVNQVPLEAMETWFSGIEANSAQMLRPLNLLMQTSSGRKWLADRFKSIPPSSRMHTPITALFANELSAVRKAGDYRFWTLEECDLLESSLSLGRDPVGNNSK